MRFYSFHLKNVLLGRIKELFLLINKVSQAVIPYKTQCQDKAQIRAWHLVSSKSSFIFGIGGTTKRRACEIKKTIKKLGRIVLKTNLA